MFKTLILLHTLTAWGSPAFGVFPPCVRVRIPTSRPPSEPTPIPTTLTSKTTPFPLRKPLLPLPPPQPPPNCFPNPLLAKHPLISSPLVSKISSAATPLPLPSLHTTQRRDSPLNDSLLARLSPKPSMLPPLKLIHLLFRRRGILLSQRNHCAGCGVYIETSRLRCLRVTHILLRVPAEPPFLRILCPLLLLCVPREHADGGARNPVEFVERGNVASE